MLFGAGEEGTAALAVVKLLLFSLASLLLAIVSLAAAT